MVKILYAVAVLAVMGGVFGAVLAIASKVFAVKTDERLPKLTDALPGANCGGCGFAGCQAYAQAVIDGRAKIGLCAAGGAASAKKMSEIMGVEAVEVEKKVAMVKCRGQNHLQKGIYEGISDCRSAMFVGGDGPSACPNGCLGFGTCMQVCKFDAIHVVNGAARVDAVRGDLPAQGHHSGHLQYGYRGGLLQSGARRKHQKGLRYRLRRLPSVRKDL